MTEATTTDLLTIEEVSERYRVPVGTLRFWRHKGVGPAGFRIGRRVVYRVADCEAWVAQQIAEQQPEPR
jgi:DNA-binding transcriptional MerR regulator